MSGAATGILTLALSLSGRGELHAAPAHVLTREEAAARAARVSRLRYTLAFRLDAEAPDVEGEETLEFDLADARRPLGLDFFGGAVLAAALNGRPLSRPAYDGARLTLPASGLSPGPNRLELKFTHPYSRDGSGLYRSKDPADGRVYAYTDLEPFNASLVFPCFDQPDLKARFRIRVSAPADWTVISTTRESAVSEEGPGRRRWEFPETPRMSTYLVSVHAGPFAVWSSTAPLPHPSSREREEGVMLRLFARQSLAQHVEAEEWLEVTRRGLEFYGEYFGIPYPFKKYDQVIVPDFNHGAMENIAAVTCSERYVLRAKSTLRQREDRADTILHEMAHMWFGDLVTMKWWDDLWLNESFASYMASKALAETGFPDAWQVFFLETKPWAYWEDDLVTTHPIEADATDTDVAFSNFDGITYGKGASTLQQVAYYLGEDTFRKGVGSYLATNAYGNATRKDFIGALSEAAGRPLEGWTKEWLQAAGLNTLRAETDCKDGRIAAVRLVQEAPREHPTLRTHKAAVALYAPAPDGLLRPTTLLPVEYTGWITRVPSLAGKPCPALVYPNAGDHDYAKVLLDPVSLETAKAKLSSVADPLERDLLWHSLWSMVLDGKLAVTDYLDLALTHLSRESDFQSTASVLNTLLGRRMNANSVLRYLAGEGPAWEQASRRAAQRLEDFFLRKLETAEADSDFQKLWFDALTGVARRPETLEHLRGFLEGKGLPGGFVLDQDRRWDIVARLRRFDPGVAAPLLAAEAKKDPSRRGQFSAIYSAVVAPDWEAKTAWLERIVSTGTETQLAELNTAMRALFPYEQAALHRRWAGEFFERLPGLAAAKDPMFLEDFVHLLAPATCRPEDSDAIASFLAAHPGLPAVPLKELRIARQENDRCVKVRALASKSL